MAKVREYDDVASKALEFCILTGVRSNELLGAEWREVDLANKTWSIPGERTKSRRPHTVPLSARCLEILRDLPRESDNGFVFVGDAPGRSGRYMAVRRLLK